MKVTGKLPNQPQPMASPETSKAGKSAAADAIADKLSAKSKPGVGGLDKTDSARVELSQRAQDIKKAKELATPSGDIDEAKVARLQKMIDEGKYKIDAEAIADRLLDEHMKMG
jgi:negative regulator of flagellin synthesis FlgM